MPGAAYDATGEQREQRRLEDEPMNLRRPMLVIVVATLTACGQAPSDPAGEIRKGDVSRSLDLEEAKQKDAANDATVGEVSSLAGE